MALPLDGWLPEVIDPNNEPPELLARFYEEVSPDGAGHYQVVVDKLAKMHCEDRPSRRRISATSEAESSSWSVTTTRSV